MIGIFINLSSHINSFSDDSLETKNEEKSEISIIDGS